MSSCLSMGYIRNLIASPVHQLSAWLWDRWQCRGYLSPDHPPAGHQWVSTDSLRRLSLLEIRSPNSYLRINFRNYSLRLISSPSPPCCLDLLGNKNTQDFNTRRNETKQPMGVFWNGSSCYWVPNPWQPLCSALETQQTLPSRNL